MDGWNCGADSRAEHHARSAAGVLTVIDHDPEAIGRIAAGEVFGWLGGAVPTKDVVVPVRLVARGSGEIPGPFSSLRAASPRLHASR